MSDIDKGQSCQVGVNLPYVVELGVGVVGYLCAACFLVPHASTRAFLHVVFYMVALVTEVLVG